MILFNNENLLPTNISWKSKTIQKEENFKFSLKNAFFENIEYKLLIYRNDNSAFA